jgi:ABC-type methionine transport system ATPase subunit
MRPATLFATALALVPAVLAVDVSKSAIVWFDDPKTSDSIIQQAKDTILKAGGKITHEYTIIKGFAVTAPANALEIMTTWGTEHSVRVEEDEVVSAL